MRHCELYIFEESVARHYYGQETKLFDLFLEYERATGSKKELLRKQIEYITKPIPALLLQQKLKKAFSNKAEYKHKKNTHLIELSNRDSRAELVIASDTLYITSEGERSFEVETMFFEVLRKCDPTFFAISVEEHRYGWLRPFRHDVFLSPNHV